MPSVITTPSAGDLPWTTKAAEIITALNFIPSSYFEGTADGGGGATKQILPLSPAFTTLTIDVEVSDVNNLFAANIYTVPSTGVYLVLPA